MAKEKEQEASKDESKALSTSLSASSILPAGNSFESLTENLGDMNNVNFPRIKFKDGKFFLSEEDEEGSSSLEGLLLFYRQQNTYWGGAYDPKNISPPDCFSLDGKKGSKYGDCNKCKFNQFGSGQGRGKACRNQVRLFLQLDGNAIPYTLLISPANIPSFLTHYIMDQITQKGKTYWKVRTKLTANKKKTETYFRVKFEMVGEYKDAELETVKRIRDFWLPPITGKLNQVADFAAEKEMEVKSLPDDKVVTAKKPDGEEPPF